MKGWGWKPSGAGDIWQCGAGWLRPVSAAVPWITAGLLLVMMYMTSGTLTAAKGVLFDLPDAGIDDGETTELVALMMPMPRETLVFFDDARYVLGDGASVSALASHISERAKKAKNRTMLVLADRRIMGGELMKLAAIAKNGGVTRMLFAEKKGDVAE